MVLYVDTSALVKLVLQEAESAALRQWLLEDGRVLASADLTRTELLRVVRRAAPQQAPLAREVLDRLLLLTLATATFEAAAQLDPAVLRTLDALHLATALELGDDLDGLVTYDDRMAEAARSHGMLVLAPR